MRSSTSCTCATTSTPSTRSDAPFGMRSATWRTERFSVVLMRSPRNIASVRSAQPGLLGEGDEEPERLVGDPVLRVVEVEAGGLGGQPLAALRVVGEQVAKVDVADLVVVLLERSPRGALTQGRRRHDPDSIRAAATHSRASWATASGVNPNFSTSSFSGADAPNVCMPTMAPPSPT